MIDTGVLVLGGALMWVGVLLGQCDPGGELMRWWRRRRAAAADEGPAPLPSPVSRLFTPPETGSGGHRRGTRTYAVYGPADLSRAGLVVTWVEQCEPPREEVWEVLLALRAGLTFDVERLDGAPS